MAGPDDNLYLVSHKNAPHGKLLRLPVADPSLVHATEIVPHGEPVMLDRRRQEACGWPAFLVGLLRERQAHLHAHTRQSQLAEQELDTGCINGVVVGCHCHATTSELEVALTA